MAENQTPNQRAGQTPNPMLRRPPTAGGPTRIPEAPTPRPQKKSFIKKALPYLIAGGGTGAGLGLGLGLSDVFF